MRTTFLLVALVAVAAGAIPAAATSTSPGDGDVATVGPVEIAAGDSPLTSVHPDDPAIDLRATGASGINAGMLLTIGNPASPVDEHAFALTNTGEETVLATIQYDYHQSPPAGAGLSFSVVDAAGTSLTDPATGSVEWTLAPGQTAYVVVTIDTTGTSPADDLSGTLRFGASEEA